MLAVNLLAALTLTGGDVSAGHAALVSAAEASAGYLAEWQERLAELDFALGFGSRSGYPWPRRFHGCSLEWIVD